MPKGHTCYSRELRGTTGDAAGVAGSDSQEKETLMMEPVGQGSICQLIISVIFIEHCRLGEVSRTDMGLFSRGGDCCDAGLVGLGRCDDVLGTGTTYRGAQGKDSTVT